MDVQLEAYLSYNLQGLPGDVFPGLWKTNMGHNHISVIVSITVSDPSSPRTPAPFGEEVLPLLWESGEVCGSAGVQGEWLSFRECWVHTQTN